MAYLHEAEEQSTPAEASPPPPAPPLPREPATPARPPPCSCERCLARLRRPRRWRRRARRHVARPAPAPEPTPSQREEPRLSEAAPPARAGRCDPAERRILVQTRGTPSGLVPVAAAYLKYPKRPTMLHEAAYRAYQRMKAAAAADGLDPNLLKIVSGYRSVAQQQAIWDKTPPARRGRYVARPGSSPHHTGRAIDLEVGGGISAANIPAMRRSAAHRWLLCNAGHFGFTPYKVEPWHWEYNPPDGTVQPALPAHPTAPGRRREAVRRAPAAPAGSGGLPGFSPSEERALRITSTFETGRLLGLGGLTGNFDGQGLSFGLLQWNIGTGSLQPLLRELDARAPARFAALFGPDAPRFRAILAPGRSRTDQLAFARSINDARHRIVEPWRTYFARLAEDPEFRAIQLRQVRGRMNAAERTARALGLVSERGLALMFDNVTQNGPAWLDARGRRALLERRLADHRAVHGEPSERERLAIIAGVVADTVKPQYREGVRRRRMTIVNGTGVVHGTRFDLERQFGLTDRPWELRAVPGGAAAPPRPTEARGEAR